MDGLLAACLVSQGLVEEHVPNKASLASGKKWGAGLIRELQSTTNMIYHVHSGILPIDYHPRIVYKPVSQVRLGSVCVCGCMSSSKTESAKLGHPEGPGGTCPA